MTYSFNANINPFLIVRINLSNRSYNFQHSVNSWPIRRCLSKEEVWASGWIQAQMANDQDQTDLIDLATTNQENTSETLIFINYYQTKTSWSPIDCCESMLTYFDLMKPHETCPSTSIYIENYAIWRINASGSQTNRSHRSDQQTAAEVMNLSWLRLPNNCGDYTKTKRSE